MIGEKKKSFKYSQGDEIIKPQFVIDRFMRLQKGDAFVADVGQHQMWA